MDTGPKKSYDKSFGAFTRVSVGHRRIFYVLMQIEILIYY